MIKIIGTDLYQWDSGRSVEVTTEGVTHVHFANKGDSKAVIMDISDSVSKIPDYLLQTGKQLCVYAVADGVTVEMKMFSVTHRERPENYFYDDDQRNYIYKLIQSAEEVIAETERVAKALKVAKDNGEFNGPQGPQGEQGPQGVPGTALIEDGTVSMDTAWSSRSTVDRLCPAFTETGETVSCEPVAGYPLTVTAAEEATAVYRCGKNLFNFAILNGCTSAYSAESNSLTVKARGVTYKKDGVALKLKDYAPQLKVGETYCLSGSCTHTGDFIYLQKFGKSWMFGSSLTITQEMLDSNVLWYNSRTNGDTTANVISNVQIDLGKKATAFEIYNGSTFAVGEAIPALPGLNTLCADAGSITVTGRADPTAVASGTGTEISQIDDSVIATDKTWSSQKIAEALSEIEPGGVTIDDSQLSNVSTWSSQHIVDTFCPTRSDEGFVQYYGVNDAIPGALIKVRSEFEGNTIIRTGQNLFGSPHGPQKLDIMLNNKGDVMTKWGYEVNYPIAGFYLSVKQKDTQEHRLCMAAPQGTGIDEFMEWSTDIYHLQDGYNEHRLYVGYSNYYIYIDDATTQEDAQAAFDAYDIQVLNIENEMYDNPEFEGYENVPFEPYKGEIFIDGELIPALPGINQIWSFSDNELMPFGSFMGIQYKQSPKRAIEELRKAILAMGGNV